MTLDRTSEKTPHFEIVTKLEDDEKEPTGSVLQRKNANRLLNNCLFRGICKTTTAADFSEETVTQVTAKNKVTINEGPGIQLEQSQDVALLVVGFTIVQLQEKPGRQIGLRIIGSFLNLNDNCDFKVKPAVNA